MGSSPRVAPGRNGTEDVLCMTPGLVAGTVATPLPAGDELIQCRHVGQLLAPAAPGVDQGGSGVQRELRVMGKKHLSPFASS